MVILLSLLVVLLWSVLLNCFKVSWGGETLQVNGRFEDIGGGWELLSQLFYLARKLEQGFQLPAWVTVDFLVQKFR